MCSVWERLRRLFVPCALATPLSVPGNQGSFHLDQKRFQFVWLFVKICFVLFVDTRNFAELVAVPFLERPGVEKKKKKMLMFQLMWKISYLVHWCLHSKMWQFLRAWLAPCMFNRAASTLTSALVYSRLNCCILQCQWEGARDVEALPEPGKQPHRRHLRRTTQVVSDVHNVRISVQHIRPAVAVVTSHQKGNRHFLLALATKFMWRWDADLIYWSVTSAKLGVECNVEIAWTQLGK